MKITYRMYITVGLIALMCLIGCGRSDAPVVLESLEEVQDAGNDAEQAHAEEGAGSSRSGDPEPENAESEQDIATVTVHVCGAVREPGVYELPGDARVADALVAAGDFAADADTEYLNLAAFLTDGQQVYVPTEEEVLTGSVPEAADGSRYADGGTAAGEDASGRININTATAAQLKTLPGIGDVKANAIIAYREAKGDLADVSEIRQVDGIKEGLYRQIKDSICVR